MTPVVTICGFASWRRPWPLIRCERLPDLGDGWTRRLWRLGPFHLSFSIALD